MPLAPSRACSSRWWPAACRDPRCSRRCCGRPGTRRDTLTIWPFSNSWVGCRSLPAGPVPFMPNRLWSRVARPLWPQPDSSMACAMVTAAGTPYRCCVAIAPGAIWSMNACWALVAFAGAARRRRCCAEARAGAAAGGPAPVWPAGRAGSVVRGAGQPGDRGRAGGRGPALAVAGWPAPGPARPRRLPAGRWPRRADERSCAARDLAWSAWRREPAPRLAVARRGRGSRDRRCRRRGSTRPAAAARRGARRAPAARSLGGGRPEPARRPRRPSRCPVPGCRAGRRGLRPPAGAAAA